MILIINKLFVCVCIKETHKYRTKTFGKPDSDKHRPPRRKPRVAQRSTLTFDLQFAVYLGLSQFVDGFAGVHAAIIRTGLPDLQRADSLAAKHTVAWVINDGYLILHPDHFRLQTDTETSVKDFVDGTTFTSSSSTYPWVCTDAAVKSSVVAGDSKGVDKWLRELRCLLEVMVIVLWYFHLQACGGKGKGMGLCMILALSGIMWEIPYVMRERQFFLFIISSD